MNEIEFISLGTKSYQETLNLQEELRRKRQASEIPDTVLTVEHPKVITQGRRPAQEDYLVAPERLRAQGFEIAAVNRGGKLTYHGPGQLVAYFILHLPSRKLGIPAFVRAVEETAIQTLAAHGVIGGRREGCPGVWIGEAKIVSIGLSVNRGVSMHGLALNIAPNLKDFGVIVPCGMVDCAITSLKNETGRAPVFSQVEQSFRQSVTQAFS